MPGLPQTERTEKLMPTFLYRRSLTEAREWDELDLYRDSYRANIDCRHAIENSIAENYDGSHLTPDVAALCRDHGIDRVGWVLAATVQEADWDGRYRPKNREWANGIDIPDTRKADYCVSSHPELVNGFIDQYREFLRTLDLHDRSVCTGEQNYEGRVLILNPDVLKDEYKRGDFQYFYARGGFGCSPDTLGHKVTGEFLKDGEVCSFERSEFLGAADESLLPEWARDRVSEIREQSNENPDETQGASFGQTMQ